MTTAGWIIMIASLTTVMGLVVFCYYRVLSKPSSLDHMHAPLEIDTHDRGT